jgi:ribulose-phosphate 3-epimerase
MSILYPALSADDITTAQKIIQQIDPYISGYQIDIMDGQLVPTITKGFDFVNEFAGLTYKQLWIHLMVEKPDDWLDQFFMQPGSIVSLHIESQFNMIRVVNRIHEKKWLPSIAINPDTSLEKIFPMLPMVHQVLVMSVDPGFSGQEFQQDAIGRVAKLVGYRQASGLKFRIGIDGGIKKNNIVQLVAEGVDDIAVSSAIFGADNPVQALKELVDLAKKS